MKKRIIYWLVMSAMAAALTLAESAAGQVVRSVEGHVVDVLDGNTITVMDADRTEWKVKLAAIDAPELGQSFGKKAKKELFDLVMDQPVSVTFDRTEGGDRIIGTVKLESQREILVSVFPININQYLVSQGMAWYDKSFANTQTEDERKLYSKLEADARQAKKGLWAEKNPVPPWDFRGKTSTTRQSTSATTIESPVTSIIANRTSRLYYLSYCPDYDKIPAKDQVSFKTPSDAQAAGFKLAKNCELK